ncbi:helix-turn-helix transcriptional regulator [Actinomadura soli]|uniref:Helix-turn-helix transcriptional regulator n=2 Tax=Actinomadura soli TaxID=2508997 RepID=A0A5C4J5R8_9ACTN|nr:helix-turn-helix transcriptional regulator [Actinomadura soli]
MLQVITPPVDQTCSEQTAELVPMDRGQAEQVAQIFKAVSDPTRLQILSMIQGSPAGEACVCDLTKPLGLTQPTISHHLKILVDAGLLTRDKRGPWAWFAVVPERLAAVRSLLA